MKQVIIKIAFVFFSVALLVTCKKDYSLETGNIANSYATGSLLDSVGNCQRIGVFGNYVKDSILTDSNFIEVQVLFATTGKYKIETDTIGGFWFSDSGHVFNTGTQTIKVRGHGKPLLLTNSTFVVSFNNNSYCFFVVPIAGATGSVIPASATYSLAGSPTSCTGAVVQGTYKIGQNLTSANTAVIQVNVTTPGGYSISTATNNGIQFKRNGIFDNVGNYAVTLYATGTPIDSGTIIIPITAGTSSCSFPVQVVGSNTSGSGGTGGGNGTTVAGNNTWQFTSGGKTFNGTIPSGGATAIKTTQGTFNITALTINGKTTGDSSLLITIAFFNTDIKKGTYTTSSITNPAVFGFLDNAGNYIFYTDYTDKTNVMTIAITSYDATTKIVKGTFSGKAGLNNTTTSATITSGSFSATVK